MPALPRWKASGDVCDIYSAAHVHQCTALHSSLHSSSLKQASRVVTLSQSAELLTPGGVHNYRLTVGGAAGTKKGIGGLEVWLCFLCESAGKMKDSIAEPTPSPLPYPPPSPPGLRSANLSFSTAAGTSKPRLPPVRGFWKWTPVSWHLEDSYREWEIGCGAHWAHLSHSLPVNTGAWP